MITTYSTEEIRMAFEVADDYFVDYDHHMSFDELMLALLCLDEVDKPEDLLKTLKAKDKAARKKITREINAYRGKK